MLLGNNPSFSICLTMIYCGSLMRFFGHVTLLIFLFPKYKTKQKNNKTEKFKNRDFIEMGLNGWHDVCFLDILSRGRGWVCPPMGGCCPQLPMGVNTI